ncbi:MAG TPA: hypothetical protein DCM54_00250 [Gammaproteobacteria bacterium]|nr:hypothetical protein [Gammaproteobacteria bacterium]
MLRLIPWILLFPSIAFAWEVVQEETPVLPLAPLTETVWRQPVAPGGEFDVVAVHRYRNRDVETVAALFFLPGTNMNGELAILNERHNLWLYLANRGVEVFAMDYRTHFVSHEVDEIDFMKEWTAAAFVDDAALLVQEVRSLLPDHPLFVGGFSRGVSYAYALAGKVDFAGLIALDGSFKQAKPRGFDLASALMQFDERGDYASVLSRRGYAARAALMSGVIEDQHGPASSDRYETVGEELASVLHRAWGPGALANTEQRLSPIRVLARQMVDYDWYFPSIQNIEGRSIASHADDPATDLDDHFGQMSLPIIYFGSGNMGSEFVLSGIYSATRSGSRDVTLHLLEGYGHADVLVADSARVDVYEVIEIWLRNRLPEGESTIEKVD